MRKRFFLRMMLPVFPCLFAAWLPGAAAISFALGREPAGVIDEQGHFMAKLAISQQNSSIVLRKLNLEEKFDPLEIKFLLPSVTKHSSLQHISLQWEKKPRFLGKQWPLESQKGFDKKTRTFKGAWSDSLSLTILDKSGSGGFDRYKWGQLVQIRLNGRPLQTKPPAVIRSDADSFFEARAEEVEPINTLSVSPEVNERAPSGMASDFSSLAPEEKFQALLKRTESLEETLAKSEKWFSWAPAVMFCILGLASGIALSFIFLYLPRKRDLRTLEPFPSEKLRLRPEFRFRNAG
jgi:hypothetical protein